MTVLSFAALATVALVGAVISAVTGVAGGVILLSALLVVLDPRAVVPVHAAVQLVANAARITAYWPHIQWSIVGRFSVAVVPGALVGAYFVSLVDPDTLGKIIAVGILVSVLLPDGDGGHPPRMSSRLCYGLGLLAGCVGTLVGTSGPLVTRALLYGRIVKEQHVATKAACQALSHAIKIPLFGFAIGFQFQDHLPLIALLGCAVVVGTIVGLRLMRATHERTFSRMTQVLLAGVALNMLVFG